MLAWEGQKHIVKYICISSGESYTGAWCTNPQGPKPASATVEVGKGLLVRDQQGHGEGGREAGRRHSGVDGGVDGHPLVA